MDKKDTQVMKNVIESLLSSADKQREQDPKYKNLFKKSTTYESMLRAMVILMEGTILDGTAVLKKKFGFKTISNDLYTFLLALPLLEHLIEKRVQNKEGSSCCVDKTYYILSGMMEEFKKR